MNHQEPANDDVRAFGELLRHVDIAMLTTIARDGTLVTRPLGTQEIQSDGTLVFFTAMDSHKVEELTEDAHCNLAYACPEKSVFASVRGRARIVHDTAKVRELWSPAAGAFFEGPDDPNLGVLYVDVDDVSYWDGPHNMLSRAFALVKATLTGDASTMGEHGHLDRFG